MIDRMNELNNGEAGEWCIALDSYNNFVKFGTTQYYRKYNFITPESMGNFINEFQKDILKYKIDL